jgi:hypothetical protein
MRNQVRLANQLSASLCPEIRLGCAGPLCSGSATERGSLDHTSGCIGTSLTRAGERGVKFKVQHCGVLVTARMRGGQVPRTTLDGGTQHPAGDTTQSAQSKALLIRIRGWRSMSRAASHDGLVIDWRGAECGSHFTKLR